MTKVESALRETYVGRVVDGKKDGELDHPEIKTALRDPNDRRRHHHIDEDLLFCFCWVKSINMTNLR